jgi:hypothetical protein
LISLAGWVEIPSPARKKQQLQQQELSSGVLSPPSSGGLLPPVSKQRSMSLVPADSEGSQASPRLLKSFMTSTGSESAKPPRPVSFLPPNPQVNFAAGIPSQPPVKKRPKDDPEKLAQKKIFARERLMTLDVTKKRIDKVSTTTLDSPTDSRINFQQTQYLTKKKSKRAVSRAPSLIIVTLDNVKKNSFVAPEEESYNSNSNSNKNPVAPVQGKEQPPLSDDSSAEEEGDGEEAGPSLGADAVPFISVNDQPRQPEDEGGKQSRRGESFNVLPTVESGKPENMTKKVEWAPAGSFYLFFFLKKNNKTDRNQLFSFLMTVSYYINLYFQSSRPFRIRHCHLDHHGKLSPPLPFHP